PEASVSYRGSSPASSHPRAPARAGPWIPVTGTGMTAWSIPPLQPLRDQLECRLGHALQRRLAVPQRKAAADHVGDAHQRPGAHLGVALGDLAARLGRAQALDVAGGELLVVAAEYGLIDELRLGHDAVEVGVGAHELQERAHAAALGLQSA